MRAALVSANGWPIVFIFSLLVLNFVPLPQKDGARYFDHRATPYAGGVLMMPDGTLPSSLPVSFSVENDGTGEGAHAAEDGALVADLNPFPGLLPTRTGLRRYSVRKGDTLTSIAAQFGISRETLQWANNGVRSVRAGDELVILPVSGIAYEVRKGDTLESIASAFRVSTGSIKGVNADYQKILAASRGTLVLPGVKPGTKAVGQASEKLPVLPPKFLSLPLVGTLVGELHPTNAIDILGKCGAPVHAAAAGTVIEDEELRSDGASEWNNGDGIFVLIQHVNGVRTRYAHLEKVSVKTGDEVRQGDTIGFLGNTGAPEGTLGCHVHLEVVGAKNPFATR